MITQSAKNVALTIHDFTRKDQFTQGLQPVPFMVSPKISWRKVGLFEGLR